MAWHFIRKPEEASDIWWKIDLSPIFSSSNELNYILCSPYILVSLFKTFQVFFFGSKLLESTVFDLEQQKQENLMRFNKAKCKASHLDHGNPHYQYKLGDKRMEHSPAKKYLGILWDG